MPFITVLFGSLLILLGLYGYFGGDADHRSLTAFIPSGFGLVMLFCGVSAFKQALRKHSTHIALLVALLGALAGWGRGFQSLFKDGANVRAVTMVFLMAILCTAYIVFGVRSFIAARRRRKEQANSESV